MDLAEGASVAGRYRLDRKLGAGGMGEVWSAAQTVTRKRVALKFLRQGDDPDVRRRFLREARAACAVQHPNVVQIHDVVELDDGAPVMVMELLEGESLEQRLRREGKMPLSDLAAILVRVVSAVGTAHAQGIVHRDLKPDNIYLAQTPEGVEIKVLDFGIAKLTAIEGNAAETGGLTQTGAMLGTPFYMSPEQAFGEKKIDHRADIWSLGVILYRGLTGVLPTRADNIGQILKIIMTNAIPPIGAVSPDLPADVVELVGRMLSADPSKRPQDLSEVKAVLERHAGVVVPTFGAPVVVDEPSTGGGPTPLSSARTPAMGTAAQPRSRVALYAGAAALALVAAVTVALTGKRGDDSAAGATTSALPVATTAPTLEATAAAVTTSAATTSTATGSPASSTTPAASVAGRGGPRPRASATSAATTTAAPAAPAASAPSMGGVIAAPPF